MILLPVLSARRAQPSIRPQAFPPTGLTCALSRKSHGAILVALRAQPTSAAPTTINPLAVVQATGVIRF